MVAFNALLALAVFFLSGGSVTKRSFGGMSFDKIAVGDQTYEIPSQLKPYLNRLITYSTSYAEKFFNTKHWTLVPFTNPAHMKFLYIENGPVDFFEAHERCSRNSEPGFRIATVRHEQDFIELKKLIRSMDKKLEANHSGQVEGLLIGARRSNGNFYWYADSSVAADSHGKAVSGYFPPWNANQPSNGSNAKDKDCVNLINIKRDQVTNDLAAATVSCKARHVAAACEYVVDISSITNVFGSLDFSSIVNMMHGVDFSNLIKISDHLENLSEYVKGLDYTLIAKSIEHLDFSYLAKVVEDYWKVILPNP